MRNTFLALFQLASVATVARADVVYVTDLPNFTALAPCAQSAISYVVQELTYTKCPPAVTALESCACTKGNNAVAVASTISSSVLYSCGSVASEDVASASIVFDNYCNQDKSMTPFASPENPVTDYITALPAFSDLAPCAESGLSYAVSSLGYSQCPPAAIDLATCACLKNQNSLLVSEYINSNIQYSCGTTMTDDIASAQAVFSGYCGLNNGTTDFPTMSELAGSLTYYITDMTEFAGLAPCAASAVSYEAFYSLTESYCPPGPGALASCACQKAGISAMVSRGLKSEVSYSCGVESSEDISSALSMFDFYCSAAKGLVKADGITAVETTSDYGDPTGAAASRTGAGSKYGSGTASKTSSGASKTGVDNSPIDQDTVKKSKVPIGAIIAAVIGGIALIILILFVGWRYRRKHIPKQNPAITGPGNDIPPDYSGKAELASTSVNPVPGQGQGYYDPSPQKPPPVPSPVPSSVYPVQQEKPGEMYSPPQPNRAEAPGTTNAAELYPNYTQGPPRPMEMQGGNPNSRHEMDGFSANMNSGPIYEMPSHYGR